MTTVNINRKVTDYYYRYKMPKIQAKVEGRGNGIKTVFVNLIEVSKALKRPPLCKNESNIYLNIDPLKYIGCELGAQTIADFKNERFIVNGAHDAEKLQNILDGFIEKYVLCGGCGNPETNLSIYPRKEQIMMKCIACGHSCKVSTTHRVSTFILKNPPIQNKKEKNLKSTNEKLSNNESLNKENEVIDEINNEINNETNDEIDGENDEEKWNVDTSESAVKERQKLLSLHVQGLTLDVDSNKPIHEKLEILQSFIKEKLVIDSDLNKHFDDIIREIKRLDIESKAIFAVSSCIFDINIIKQLSKHHEFLRKFCQDQHRIQKYLIGSIERIVEQNPNELLVKVPIIFKIMFEAEIVDEDVFLDWDSKRSSRFVSKENFEKIKTAAYQFIDWLKNAEEESSSEDDQLSNENSSQNDAAEVKSTTQTTNQDKKIVDPEDDGSEIDIDDI